MHVHFLHVGGVILQDVQGYQIVCSCCFFITEGEYLLTNKQTRLIFLPRPSFKCIFSSLHITSWKNINRNRILQYPAIVNCTTIDWFCEWPKDALLEVAERYLDGLDLGSLKGVRGCTHTHRHTQMLFKFLHVNIWFQSAESHGSSPFPHVLCCRSIEKWRVSLWPRTSQWPRSLRAWSRSWRDTIM